MEEYIIKTITFKGKEFQVRKGSANPEYSFDTFDIEEHELRDQYWNIKEGDVVIDVGASYGSYTLTACAMGATVYAFEPEPLVVQDLANNVAINHWEDRCEVFPTGMYSAVTAIHMNEYAPHWTVISCRYNMETIDRFVEHKKLTKLDWLKIDIEGAETHAVLGGLKTIRELKPKMLIECHDFLDNTLSKQVMNLILSVEPNYGFRKICPRDNVVTLLCEVM